MQLDKHIAKLLENHDCVIVPDFGGFIGNYEPAKVDEVKNLIYPPSKRLLFNPNLTSNDGLLGNEVSVKENVPYDEALDAIREKVKEWQNTLNEGGRINVAELGFIFSQHDRIVFEQSREINLLLSAYGLAPIRFVPAEKEKIEEKIETTPTQKVKSKPKEVSVEEQRVEKPLVTESPALKEESKVEETPILALKDEAVEEENAELDHAEVKVVELPKKRGKVLRYAVVAACIPLAFYSYWIPMETDFLDTGSVQLSDFNPLNKSHEINYQSRHNEFNQDSKVSESNWKSWEELTEKLNDDVKVYNYQFDEALYIPVALNRAEESENEDVLNVAETTDVEDSVVEKAVEKEDFQMHSYHVITGCFSVKSNAVGLVEELQSKGYDARILDQNKGLYRVTAVGCDNRTTAKSSQSKLEGDGYSSWVLKN